MAENRRGKENRFYFSRGQMVLLGAAFTLSSLIIFFLGVYVGKGIEERRSLKKDEPLVKIPIKPGAQPSSAAAVPTARDEITFNDPLPEPAGTVALAEERSQPIRQAESGTVVDIKEKTSANSSSAPSKPVERKVEKIVLQEPAKKPEPVNVDAQEPAKNWRAQVNAYPDEHSAKQIVDRLKNKGYKAYVSEAQNNGKTWYRVSVGRFTSRDEADKVLEQLRGKENFPKAFLTSK